MGYFWYLFAVFCKSYGFTMPGRIPAAAAALPALGCQDPDHQDSDKPSEVWQDEMVREGPVLYTSEKLIPYDSIMSCVSPKHWRLERSKS